MGLKRRKIDFSELEKHVRKEDIEKYVHWGDVYHPTPYDVAEAYDVPGFFDDNKDGDVVNLEQYASDGRLTEPSDGVRYDWRKMIDAVKKEGRPLTEEEVKVFRLV